MNRRGRGIRPPARRRYPEGRCIADDPSRHLPLEGTRNVRDVGGYPAAGGRRTRWRTLLRSDELTALPGARPGGAHRARPAPGHRPPLARRARPAPNVFARLRRRPLHEPPAPRRRPDAPRGPGRHVPPRVRRPGAAAGGRRAGPARARRPARDHRLRRGQGPDRGRDRAAARPRRRPDAGHRRGLRLSARYFSAPESRRRCRRTGATSRSSCDSPPELMATPSSTSTRPTAAPARCSAARDSRTRTSIDWSTD